jgi:hypothetical protein
MMATTKSPPGHAVITDTLEAIVFLDGIEVARHHREGLSRTAAPHHDRFAVRQDAGHRLVITDHFPCASRQGNQPLLLTLAVTPMDDAHGLQLTVMQIDEGTVIIEVLQGFDMASPSPPDFRMRLCPPQPAATRRRLRRILLSHGSFMSDDA